jgi:hypothetical protein
MKRLMLVIIILSGLAACVDDRFPNGSFVYLRSSCQKYLVTDNDVFMGTIVVQEKTGAAYRLTTTDLVTTKDACTKW